jgi:hypothetical protein
MNAERMVAIACAVTPNVPLTTRVQRISYTSVENPESANARSRRPPATHARAAARGGGERGDGSGVTSAM